MNGAVVRRFLGIIVAALAFSTSAVAQSSDQPFSKWFKYNSTAAAKWQFTGDPADPLRVEVRRKDGPQGKRQKILVLYPRPSSAYDIEMSEILRVLEIKEHNPDILVINFELKDAAGQAAIKLAEANKYDLILSMGSESTEWLFKNYKGGTIPVVTICSKDPVQLGQMKDYGSSKNNFAFTSLNVLVDVQYSYLKELKPNVKNIAILVDSKNKSAIETQGMPIVELAKKNNVTTHWVAVENPAESKAELAKLIPDAVEAMRKNDPDLSNSVFWITGSTAVFREIRTINEFAGKVPVLSVVPEIVTKGDDTAALAIGISFKSNAQLAAVYADQILRGVAKAGDLKVGIVSPPDIAISFRKTHEIGMRVPFDFFENATFIYDYEGVAVRFIKDE